jgi:hypothetical protein
MMSWIVLKNKKGREVRGEMAITWSNAFRDYINGLGLGNGTNIQTLVTRLTAASTATPGGLDGSVEDSTLVLMFGAIAKDVLDIARSTYGQGLSQANMLIWIKANRPNISDYLATLYSYIVATDLNTNLIDTRTADDIPAKEVYVGQCAALLNGLAHQARYFAGLYLV